jgi:hypothetical protein
MNYGALLRRAWEITRKYRVLWLFGILVALTAGGTSPNTSWQTNSADFRTDNWPNWLPGQEQFRQFGEQVTNIDPGAIMGILIACCCLLLIFALVALIVQYVARVALIRSVNQIEETGVAPTWRQGFGLGWSNRAFRLWLLEFLLGILFVVGVTLLLALAASPLLLLLARNEVATVIGIVLTALLGLPVLLVIVVAVVIVSVLGQFWSREIALADRGIGEAFSRGVALVRARLKDVGVFWLLMAGINIAFSIVLIPVFFVLLGLAVLVGGGLGFALFSATQNIVPALAVGLPVFLLLLGIPMTLIGGLFETFKSSAWTLVYRDVAPPAPPVLNPVLEA